MALKAIKDIINNKGFVINSKDRAIFESGDLRSFFGISSSDAIEFIVYDSSDNQLPQGNSGELVRYIQLTNENISDYILIPEGTVLQKYSLPTEYFIDVERLLKEAGYIDGVYKTQITLVNKRIGSEMESDKLYINEISPSRTEVRLFPILKSSSDAVKANLKERFGIFINDGTFRDDVVSLALQYIEKIDPTKISIIITSTYGEAWLTNFIKEYKVQDINVFITRIYNTFIQSCIYEFTNKVSDIRSGLYGKPKGIQPSLSLNISEVKAIINRILVESINKYTIIPETRNTQRNIENVESFDNIEQILVRKESDLVIDTQAPEREITEIRKDISDTRIVFEEKVQEQIPDTSDDIVIDLPDDIINDIIIEDDLVDSTEVAPDQYVPPDVDRVDIPDRIIIDGEEFQITPLPKDIVGGSPVSGENAPGNPQLGESTQRGGVLGGQNFTNPQDAIQNEYQFRDRKNKNER
jgi:hypothetical protein